ncbi:MAG: hypothetical protein PHO37_00510 [Kiritimatiellae bacterium]|nr:hypothetical protein [Kiritimatiellia bacterium]
MKKLFLLLILLGHNLIAAELSQRVTTFSLTDVALKDVVRFVSSASGVPIVCTPESAEKTVSLYFSDISLEAALGAMCRANGLYMNVSPESVAIITTIEQHLASQAFFSGDFMESITIKYPAVFDVGDVLKGLFRERIVWERPDDQDIDSAVQVDQALERMQLLTARSQFDSFQNNQQMRRASSTSTRSRGNMLRQGEDMRQLQSLSNVEEHQMEQMVKQAVGGDVDRNVSALIYISALPEVNTLLIRSSDRDAVQLVKKAVEEVDKPRGQVLLRVMILAATLDDSTDTGVEWLFEGGDTSLGFAQNPIQSLSDNLSEYTINAPVGSVVSEHLKVRLTALQKAHKLVGLANPSILVADNEAANVFVGQEAKFLDQIIPGTVVNTDGGITTTEPTPSFITRNIGLSLLITPRVHADHSVTLRVMQERTRADKPPREINYGGNKPVMVQDIDQEVVTSTLVAENDSLIILGGLITDSESETERGIPWLKDIPWLGALFRSNSVEKKREELMVVLRPYVIAAPGEAEGISRQVIEQLKVKFREDEQLAILDDVVETTKP